MMFLDIIDIEGILRTIFFWILKALLFLVKGLYNIFIIISEINVFDGKRFEIISGIYKRVQAILVIVMVFYLIFQFVQYILQPEVASDKNKGVEGSIKRIVTVVLLMAFTPTIFNFSYELKDRILHSQIIEKIVMDNGSGLSVRDNDFSCSTPDSVTPGECTDGGKFAARLLGLFVTTNRPNAKICENEFPASERIFALQRELAGQTTWSHKWGCGLNDEIDDNGTFYVIDFQWLVAVPATLFIIWMFVLYCVEAGRMVFQFAMLQLIAPVPIMSYLSSNKDNMFNKWLKQCVTTYIDVFIRLLIINFVLLLCSIIPNLPFGELSDNMFVKIFLILGLMLFAVKAPALIKELLPKGGGAAAGGFGVGKKSAAASTLLGATRGTARALGRTARGLYKAGSAVKTGIDLKRRNDKGFRSQLKNHVATAFYRGVNNAGERLNSYLGRRNQTKEEYKKSLDELSNAIDEAEKIGYRKSVKNKALAQKTKAELEAAEYEKNDLISQLNNVNNKIERRKLLSSKTNLTKEERVELDQLNNQNSLLVEKQSKLKSSLEKVENKIQKSVANVSDNLGVSNYTRASNEYEQAVRELKDAKQSGDSTRIKNAESNLKEKKEILKNVERENDGNAIQTLFAAQEELEAAKKLPADAKDREKIISDAKNKVDSAQKAFSDEKRKILNMDVEKYLGSTVVDRIEEAKQEVKQKREEMNNIGLGVSERIAASGLGNLARGVSDVVKPLTNVAGGIVKNYIDDTIGNVTGAYKGAQTADMTKVAADNKKYVDELRKREEFIAAGGDPGIINTVKTKVSSFASDYLGVPSAKEKIDVQNAALDLSIKSDEAIIKNQQGFKEGFKEFNNGAEDMLTKHKIKAKMDNLAKLAFSDGSSIVGAVGTSGSDLMDRYSEATKAANERRDTKVREAALSAKGLGEKYSQILKDVDFSKSDCRDKFVDTVNADPSIKDKQKFINQFDADYDAYKAGVEATKAQNHEKEIEKLIKEETMAQGLQLMATTGDINKLDKEIGDAGLNVGIMEFFAKCQTICADRKAAVAAIEALRKTGNGNGPEVQLLSKSNITMSDLIGFDIKSIKNINNAMDYSMSIIKGKITHSSELQRQGQEAKKHIELNEKFNNVGSSGSSGGK